MTSGITEHRQLEKIVLYEEILISTLRLPSLYKNLGKSMGLLNKEFHR